MFGDKALELVKELKRSMDGTLPPYNVRYWFLLIQQILAGNFPSKFLVRLLSNQRPDDRFQSRQGFFAYRGLQVVGMLEFKWSNPQYKG